MKKIKPILFFAIILFYLEIITKYIMTNHILNIGILYLIIFSIPVILILNILSKIFNDKFNKFMLFLLTFILIVYFEVQYIFYRLFSVPFSFSTLGLADQALDFTSIIKDAILSNWFFFILLLLPFITLIFIHKKIDTTKYEKKSLVAMFLMFIISYLSTFLFLFPNKNAYNSSYKLYYSIDDPQSIIDRFGMITYSKVDIRRQLFGYNNEIVTELDEEVPEQPKEDEVIEYGYNELNIDFANLEAKNNNLKSLNNFFANSKASEKTEYTGMFKGKNLIFILAEGFNEIAVDETRTPTLYKMINTGFVFKNFYSPVFLSTTGGEFQATTGLIPTQETLKIWKSEQPKIAYALGNSFGNIGYRAQSYHNWTYTYYKRNITMKTLGFTNYKGCGNGLEKMLHTADELKKIKYGCKCYWLEYDSDMANVTAPQYMGKDGNFVTYYVTVSGHSPYSASDNVARHHFDTVKGTNYSSIVKYYLAGQVELDKMLEKLVEKLTESGELDNTVIALVGDHYPYTLSTAEVNAAASYKKDGIVEINHSNFLLWSNAMEEPIVVDKVGSQIDVLPTLLNLFGIEYDSRLIIGKDILSDYEGLAIFSNRSWVSDYGTYYSNSKKFVLKNGKELDDINSYVKRINQRVSNAFSVSKMIVDNDYYNYVLK